MLTGSFAMHFHASPRMTRDIDIVIQLSEVQGRKLCTALGPDVYCDVEMTVSAIRDSSMFNAIFQKAGIKIDFILKKDSEYAAHAFARREEMPLLGRTVFVSTPEDLIVSKLEWAKDSLSEMQLRDVSNLLKVRDLDLYYVEMWVKKLGLEAAYDKAKSF